MNLLLSVLLTASVLFASPIDNLKAGEWYEVPNSHLASVPPGGNVIAPWSGGAFDTKRNQLFVWGGGHGDYSGNEVYIFNLDSLKWFLQTNPSSTAGYGGGCTNIFTDSQPVSRHTYAGMDYVGSADKVFSGGGFTWPSACGDPIGWLFDYAKNKWVVSANIGYGSRGMSGYDPITGKLWVIGGTGTGFRDYNGATNVWTSHNNPGFMGQIITVDPDDRLLVGLNKGNVNTYVLDGAGAGTAAVHAFSGDTASINSAMPDGDYKTPGFVWDPVLKCFVAWNGGADVYTLNLSTYVWTRVRPASTNTVIPTAAAAQGTYGRFRYSPKNNVYVVVNSISENVFIYRMTAGTSVEARNAKTPVSSMAISPNPLQSGADLAIQGKLANGTIRIVNAQGRLITRFDASEKTIWRAPSHLTPGIYFVQWTGIKGSTETRPFVVAK